MRRSPSFPCICGSEDWSYDANQVRWLCNQCVRAGRPTPTRPNFEEVFDFENWYYSIQNDYESIRDLVNELENEQPKSPRETLVHSARVKRAVAEKKRAEELADIATYLHTLKEYGEEGGEIYIRLPQYEIELRFEWSS